MLLAYITRRCGVGVEAQGQRISTKGKSIKRTGAGCCAGALTNTLPALCKECIQAQEHILAVLGTLNSALQNFQKATLFWKMLTTEATVDRTHGTKQNPDHKQAHNIGLPHMLLSATKRCWTPYRIALVGFQTSWLPSLLDRVSKSGGGPTAN